MDGRLARGEETRRVTLQRAVELASVEGLEGITIGRLASELELSKSGIFALFGSKEDLQLAAIEHAEKIFRAHVITPAATADPGLPRLVALLEHWLTYSKSRVFPGGCFFAAVTAEFDARRGRVHDAIRSGQQQWGRFLERLVTEAVEAGHLPADTDAAQLAFEVFALARGANTDAVLSDSEVPYARAITAIHHRLGV
ncbi:TetR/AcrR family transcriptional regulator [Actinokineospora sp. PR83]|uniref:TetR/AcrR family transcriptional regulator n=1 Tax=Actinokineospora sp. PR83 TaxID=2884908 RepID=UPI0027E1C0EF|nr:TetR/AcrR family transcriptional regulator [Actinokineospora sp. PR83]MCG8920557.1 TetR/AcrR family transcriptional regulator [Actinokineospora sp. PR83]